ncbi:hypothetical protein [Microbacterium sp.]|uniref:hypothetical protein n=1 Tax=Microbacterium sp. TaxID=51671 RepID=UPI0025D23CE7|nr:hypothetical protein [Microbacterium sp.]
MADDTLKTHGNRAKYHQRVADAWAMRVRGADWATIAGATRYSSPQNAMRAVRNYVGKLPAIESSDDLRSLWRERLEYLWPLAARDAEAGRPGALRAAVAVSQRAAQLDGLDAPQRFEITPGEADLERLVDEIVRRSGHEEILEADVIDLDVVRDEIALGENGEPI